MDREAELSSTSRSGATRARAARSTSPRDGPSGSTAGSNGVEWDAQDGTKRRKVEIIADSVQFLGGRGEGGAGGDGGNQFVPAGASGGSDADFQGSDDDIPF